MVRSLFLIFNYIIESLPIVTVLGGAIYFICFSSFIPDDLYSAMQNEKFVVMIFTITTVIDALMITSLSVFGSSKSVSVLKLSKDSKLVSKFFIYIYGILIFSIVVFFTSVFSSVYTNLYLYSVINLLSFFISYSHISISMFKKNIQSLEKEEMKIINDQKKLLFHLVKIEQKMEKMIELLYQLKNK